MCPSVNYVVVSICSWGNQAVRVWARYLASLKLCMHKRVLAGIFKYSVKSFWKHAQVIFGGLALEGCVASHCPGYELPRHIKAAIHEWKICSEVHGAVSCNRNCCSYYPKERTKQDLKWFWVIHHTLDTYLQANIVPACSDSEGCRFLG